MAPTLNKWQRWRFERKASAQLGPVIYGLEQQWWSIRTKLAASGLSVTTPPLEVWIIGRVVATPMLSPKELGRLIRIANSQNIELQTSNLFYRVVLTPDGFIEITEARRKPKLVDGRNR